MICPSCNVTRWKAKARGIRRCPNCAAILRLTKQGISEAPADITRNFGRPPLNISRPVFPLSAGSNYVTRTKARLYHVVAADGSIACASCANWTTFVDSIDGALDGDGLMKVDRAVRDDSGIQVGTETVYIPSNVRGRFCTTCSGKFPVRAVGRLAVPSSRFTLDYQMVAELTPFKPRSGRKADAQETWKYTLEKVVDLDPTWAHTFDATWLSCSTPGKVFRRDDDGGDGDRFSLEPVGKHPGACGCHKCMRRERREPNDRENLQTFLASLYRGPLAFSDAVTGVVPMRVMPFAEKLLQAPRSHYVTPWQSYARIRPASNLHAAMLACIANGYADNAATYARIIARQVR